METLERIAEQRGAKLIQCPATGRWFVSFNYDAAQGPFPTRERALLYAARQAQPEMTINKGLVYR